MPHSLKLMLRMPRRVFPEGKHLEKQEQYCLSWLVRTILHISKLKTRVDAARGKVYVKDIPYSLWLCKLHPDLISSIVKEHRNHLTPAWAASLHFSHAEKKSRRNRTLCTEGYWLLKRVAENNSFTQWELYA